jgi:glycosyltransferase involved in cell wall biosynthesis
MRIAILASGLPPDVRGGGEFSSQIIAESLQKAGAEVHVLCCGYKNEDYSENGLKISKIVSPNIYWNFVPQKGAYKKIIWHGGENYNPIARRAIKAFLERIRPDIFLTSTIENFGAESWNAPKECRIKVVHVLRSYYPICWRGTTFKRGLNCVGTCWDCNLATIGRRKASNRVNGVIGLSEAVLRRHLEQGLFSNASRALIADPVSTVQKNREPRILSSTPTFGYLGFLTSNKGIELIADAMRLTPQLKAMKLQIAGKGDEAYIKTLMRKFEGLNADFIGWVESSKFLSHIDFLIVPSIWHEPFGRIVVEAFSSGVPVIGSRIGGVGEMVVPGVNGFAFEPSNSHSLADVMTQALHISAENYRRLSFNALGTALNYTGDVISRKYLKYFDDILSGKAVAGHEWSI